MHLSLIPMMFRPCSGSAIKTAAMEEVRRGSIKRQKCCVLKPEVDAEIV